jgi:hypothetical protein
MPGFLQLFSAVTEWLVLPGLPLLIYAIPPRTGRRNLAARFFAGVAAVWIGWNLHRYYVGPPAAIQRAEANGRPEYDGIGGNIAILLGGWIAGIFGATIALGIFHIAKRVRDRRTRHTTPAAHGTASAPSDLSDREHNPYAAPLAPASDLPEEEKAPKPEP